jgi:hypothetical protein
MAAMSWMFTSTEQNPAHSGSASMSLLQIPSAARSSASSPWRMTAASSPKEATTSGASIFKDLIISPMACFRVTPSYSRTDRATASMEQIRLAMPPRRFHSSIRVHER